jgi:hypothetical protein
MEMEKDTGRRLRRRAAAVAAAALAVGWLAGCSATSSAPGPVGGDARSSGAPASPVASASGPAAQAQNAADLKLATTTAAANLRAFIPPPGARRLAGPPVGTWRDVPVPGGQVAGTQSVISSLTEHSVLDISWWQVPGQPKAVLAWVLAHGPAGFRGNSVSSAGPMAVPGQRAPSSTDKPANVYRTWTDFFARFSGPAVLDTQELLVVEIQNGLGQTYMQVDSLVSWIPPKPPLERVTSSARVVTINAVALNGGQPGRPVNYAPVTITDPAKVARIAATVNGLYRYAGQICAPLVGANGIKLEFRASPGGSVLATVVATDTGCQQIQFGIPGQPGLPNLGNNGTFVSTVLSISGLAWYR